MMQNKLALVSGANGHLGNNLVRLLLNKGIPVQATVRNVNNKVPFEGLDCEVVYADITDKKSLVKALQGVDTFYAVAAAFKLWAKDPEKEIYDVNLEGTRNSIEAAVEAGVKKIVYVSSIAALNYSQIPIQESYGYNPDRRNVYYNSKNDGEKLAFELAEKYGIELVSVLPAAMIGSEAFAPLSTSYSILKLILNKALPVDTRIELNWIDVKDVAEGCYLAAVKGKNGERYILANEQSITLTRTTEIAKELYPESGLKIPKTVPKFLLYCTAGMMELMSKIKGEAPVLTRENIVMFSGLKQNFIISKSREELGFSPKKPEEAVKDALQYLMKHKYLLEE